MTIVMGIWFRSYKRQPPKENTELVTRQHTAVADGGFKRSRISCNIKPSCWLCTSVVRQRLL